MNQQSPTLRTALPLLWQECRTAPPRPEKSAPFEEHWTFLWRTLLADSLTWTGLAVLLTVLAFGVLLSVLGLA